MSKERPRNIAASVRQRLTDLARKQGAEFQLVLTRYAIERLLYRLSQSEYRDEFILKGAMLFQLWADHSHRPTRDLDLLGKGPSSTDRLVEVFRTVTSLTVEDDGLTFDLGTITAERIKEDQEYEGGVCSLRCPAVRRHRIHRELASGWTVVSRTMSWRDYPRREGSWMDRS